MAVTDFEGPMDDGCAPENDTHAVTCNVRLEDVCFSLEGRAILKGVSFVCGQRRIGIVGRNGSGKSTLARMLAGLIMPDAGNVLINGKNIAKDRRAALQDVGILFQNPDHQIIFPTVSEELTFGLEQQGHDKATAQRRARATLEKFGKPQWEEVYINRLSQGQKHLVCLMAIVAMAPRVLILDEPFAGLDIPTKAQLVRYLNLYDGALIHISHDPQDLMGYDQTIWLDQGQVRETGESACVLSAYVTEMNRLGGGDDITDLTR